MRLSDDQKRRIYYAEGQAIKQGHEAGRCGNSRRTPCDCHEAYMKLRKKYRALGGEYFEPSRFARSDAEAPRMGRDRREGRK